MQRIIVEPPVIGAAALAELKHWLGISRPNDDAALTGLLEISLAICEGFTGRTPLRQVVEETVALVSGWQELVSRPVRAVTAATLIKDDGTREAFPLTADHIIWRVGTSGCVQLLQPSEGQAIALQLEVGIADDWAGLPAPLKQGIIRLAAHYYRDRDGSGENKASAAPPASVTALWRPWREVRLV
jgi:uncharacterized phiE125 gp8 family phage protein